MSKRDTKILEILTDAKRIEVATLAEQLRVSNVTMRKDLDALQSRGLVVIAGVISTSWRAKKLWKFR